MDIKSIINYWFLVIFIACSISSQMVCAQNKVGDTPSYVSIADCPEPVLFAIHNKAFPQNLIHSYNIKKTLFNNSTLYIVDIEYGEAQDCPSGCFYESFIGVVSLENRFVYQLPGPRHDYIISLIYSQPPFTQKKYIFDKLLDNFTLFKLAQKNNQFGWEIFFTQPYPCYWIQNDKSTVTHTRVIHEGKKMHESFYGSIFVYFKNGELNWDFTNLQNRLIKEEKIVTEEKIKLHNQ